tara:strand:+ start:774 stop:1409 length:636 start_codon:yes stop_codon:yes gene_type:complete
MALDFPTSPSVNDLYTDSGRTWRWNGTGWAMLPGAPVAIDTTAADILSATAGVISADDAAADKLVFWDDSASKLTYLAQGTGLTIDGTTIYTNDVIVVACSDEVTAITTGTAKVTFRMPFAATLVSVRASLTAATTGTEMQIDINETGTSVFNAGTATLRINSGATTSVGATNAFVISDSSLADNAVMTIDVDQVGTGAKGLKVHMYLRRT